MNADAARPIRFDLADAPRGVFRLRLGLIMKTARTPVVQVEANGHRGWFYQPVETYREGDEEGAIFPQYATGEMVAEIPTEFLRQGANEIALTAVADPLSTQLPGGDTTEFDTLIYDALALENDLNAQAARGVVNAKATPTIFYKRDRAQLSEIVFVTMSWRGGAPQGSITLALPGWNQSQRFSNESEFGEERFAFLVPEFTADTRATIKINANDESREFSQTLNPARKWTVYLVPHEHLDVGYSDFQTKLAELHSRIIDEAMQMNRAHPEFRFSLDGYWQAEQLLDGRSEAEKQKFYDAIREKKIFVPAQRSIILTGFPTAEALIRSFYGSYKPTHAHGGDWNYANATDVPSYSWSYASILHAAGIKYFSAAANADRGPVLMSGAARVLVLKSSRIRFSRRA